MIASGVQSGRVTRSEYLKRCNRLSVICNCRRSSSMPIFCFGVASNTYASRLIGVTAAAELMFSMIWLPSVSTTPASHPGRSPLSGL